MPFLTAEVEPGGDTVGREQCLTRSRCLGVSSEIVVQSSTVTAWLHNQDPATVDMSFEV